MKYKPPVWLPGGHAQTIWGALFSRSRQGNEKGLFRERWILPDGDFVDVDRQMASTPCRPLLVLFHGLEGSSKSHYAQAFAEWAGEKDVNFALPHFRGCSGEMNLASRAYHSGDHAEIDDLLSRFRIEHQSQGGSTLIAAGVSLGGNALMRWAAEQGECASQKADAVASICAPLDLMQSGMEIGKGFNRHVYTRMFLRSMKPKALAKLAQHPGLFDEQALRSAKDLYEFDGIFTAPLHGFKNTDDYWLRASAKPLMRDVRLPALALNALNDPFVPAHSLPQPQDVSDSVTLWHTMAGGHVGYPKGRFPGHVRAMPEAVGAWLMNAAGHPLANANI